MTRVSISREAVIAPSALSLVYPKATIEGYSREQFLDDLVNEAEKDIRRCFASGAHSVQLDFTEARFSLKIDPTGQLLRDFVRINNRVLDRFEPNLRHRLGVHVCPGSFPAPFSRLAPRALIECVLIRCFRWRPRLLPFVRRGLSSHSSCCV